MINTPTLSQFRKSTLSYALAYTIFAATGILTTSTNVRAADPDSTDVGTTQSYNIPAGTLGNALNAFANSAGISLQFDANFTRTLNTQGLQGKHSIKNGLTTLLEGTGLTAVQQNNGIYTLKQGNILLLSTIKVEGDEIKGLTPAYAGGQVARGGKLGMLGNRDFMDTPFNQTSYTAELIQNQQARNIADIAINDPSVQATWSSTGYTSPLMIRGFAASNHSVGFNGLYGIAPTFDVDMDMVERVEILKGPSAMLSGMQATGSVGGSINLVPKRAGEKPLTRLTGNYMSDSQFGAQVDTSRRFGDDQAFGARFNGSFMDGDANVDDQSRQQSSAVVGMDYQTNRLRASMDFGYQKQDVNAPILVTNIGPDLDVPNAPDSSTNWFFPWSWVDIDDTFAVARGEFDINENWMAYAAAGAKETNWERLTYFPTLTNNNGDITGTPSHLQYLYKIDSQEAGIRGAFKTGSVDHEISLNATRFRQRNDNASEKSGSELASNIYNPSNHSTPIINDLNLQRTTDNRLTSIGISDIMTLMDDKLQVILGLRQQNIETKNFTPDGKDYDDSALTPNIGFILKPWSEDISLYANYSEGLQSGVVVGSSYNNANETLEPYTSEQYEMGVKIDWGKIATTISAFQISQSSALKTASGELRADGEQRNRGLEFNAFGEVSDNLRILGGITFVDAELSKTEGSTYDGNKATGIPEINATLGAEWDLTKSLTLLGRVIHTGSQEVDQANTQSIPSWERVDIGARYVFNEDNQPITLRANLENLFDEDYWTSSAYYPGYLSNSAPRTLLLSVSVDF